MRSAHGTVDGVAELNPTSAALLGLLQEGAKVEYAKEQEAARAAVRTATDPYAKALAEFAVARNKAVVKLLESIPTT